MNFSSQGTMSWALQRDRSSPRRQSFTLLEVLLALALTALVVGVTGRIAVCSLTTQETVTRIISQLQREAVLFDQLDEDFASLPYDLPSEQTPLMVFGTPRQVLQLSTLSAVPAAEGSLHLIRRPAQVRYRLVDKRPDQAGFDLIREVIDRTRASARPVPETIATQMAGFEIEVLQDGQWVRKYPSATGHSNKATALRVSCRWLDTQPVSTRLWKLHHAD